MKAIVTVTKAADVKEPVVAIAFVHLFLSRRSPPHPLVIYLLVGSVAKAQANRNSAGKPGV